MGTYTGNLRNVHCQLAKWPNSGGGRGRSCEKVGFNKNSRWAPFWMEAMSVP
jgi:hypothetical protein